MGGPNSGGARSRPGPAPDPEALRLDRPANATTWRDLPAGGRRGKPPAWPLSDPSARERTLWALLWARPEAIFWSEVHAELEVALHVRTFARAEAVDASMSLVTEARVQADALGYTDSGRARKRWRIVKEAAPNDARQSAPRRTNTAKADILRLVKSG
jgi:hypothetical protein